VKTNQYTFFITSCSFLLRMKNVSDESCREKTHFMFNNFFLNCAIYEIVWKNIGELGRQQRTMWCMHIACWILKVTNTHFRLCNTYCFSTSTVAACTHLSVMLYVHYLSCYYL